MKYRIHGAGGDWDDERERVALWHPSTCDLTGVAKWTAEGIDVTVKQVPGMDIYMAMDANGTVSSSELETVLRHVSEAHGQRFDPALSLG